MSIKKNIYLSCILPVFNESEVIEVFLTALIKQLDDIIYNYEIIVIDDGSEDQTLEIISCYQQSCNQLKLIELSRNFGKEAALTAGIEVAEGDAVLLIDADFQHPLKMIPVFLDFLEKGYDMVYGVRSNRKDESLLKKKGSQLFYQIMSTSTGIKVPSHSSDFRVMNRKVVSALKQLSERNRFMKGMYAWVGYKSIGIPYEVEKRFAGTSCWNYSKLTGLALSGITSFTTFPLRLVGWLGLTISFVSVCYALFILGRTLVLGSSIPGWPTMIVTLAFIGGIQLLSLGVLGEYIASVFNEVKQRPNYLIKSSVGFKKKHRSGK